MRLPFSRQVKVVEVARSCGCERPRPRMNGRCRSCGGVVEWPVQDELPHGELWWAFTEEENRR